MKTKKNIVGLTYRHPHMPVLLKQQANNITSKFLEVMTSCFFFVLYIQPLTHVVGSPATLIDNIFMNSVAIPFP